MSNNLTSKYLFDYIYLAEVSYANFSKAVLKTKTDKVDATEAAISGDKKNGGREKPLSLAELVTKNYEVIAHYADRDNDDQESTRAESGFSATLFKGKKDGHNPDSYVLGFKGTDGNNDIFTVDIGGIVGDGVASTQIIDL